MRTLKITGFVLAGLVALIVLAAAAVLILVDPNDYRADIERRVGQASGRPLKIGGKLDLKLFPWLALQVNDVSLGNPPGYGSEPFLTVKHADVGVKLLPLLHKQIEVRRVKLTAPTVYLVSRGKGENNWQDLNKAKSPQEAQAADRSTQTTIAGVDVEGATLVYRDEEQKEKKDFTRLSNLQLHIGALGGAAAMPVNAQFDYDDGTLGSAMHFAVQAQVRRLKDSSRVTVKDLTIESKPLLVRSPELVLDTRAGTLAPATLDIHYGELPIHATAAGENLFGERVVTGKVSLEQVALRKLMPSFDMRVPNTRDPRVLNAFALKSDYRLTEKALQLRDLNLSLDDTQVRGTVSVDDLDTKALSFDLGIDSIDVDRYRGPEVKTETKKSSGPKPPPTDLPIAALRKLNAHGTLRIGHAQLADIKFDDVRLPVDAAGGRVVVMPQARLFGGSYNGDIMLDARPAQARLSLNEKARGIDVGSFVNAAFKTTRVVGLGDANAVLTGTGNTDEAILATLKGKIDANVKDGAFNGVDLWYELRRALALLKGAAPPPRSEPVRTQFRTFTGSATLADGVLRNDDLTIDMDYLKARGKGTLNIGTQAVDYRLTAEAYKLPPSDGSAGAPAADLAELKALEIPITITGTLANMTVRPDLGVLAKARLHQEVDKRKEDLKKKLNDKLKDLLGR